MKDYNNKSRISFLSDAAKKLINGKQNINIIIEMINNQDSFYFDFSEVVNTYKCDRYSDLDGFCCDETLSHYMHKKKPLLKTDVDREIYFLALKNHLLKLEAAGEL